MNFEKEKVTKYSGTYRGVGWEINDIRRDSIDFSQWWTYYLWIDVHRLDEKGKKDFILRTKKSTLHSERRYYDTFKIDNLDLDFHCGCTWYSKENDKALERQNLKIGCDYNHYWDEKQYYGVESIYFDVKKTIDRFLKRYSYKRWCCNCGSIEHIEDGILTLKDKEDEGNYNFKCKKCVDKES